MAAPTVSNSPALSFAESIFDHLTAKFTHPVLFMCDYADEDFDCRDKATVHLLATEEDLCQRHFEKRLREAL